MSQPFSRFESLESLTCGCCDNCKDTFFSGIEILEKVTISNS